MSLCLLDKSAYVRGAYPGDQVSELCLCAITRLEVLYSARSEAGYRTLEDDLAQFRDLRIDAQTVATAIGAQRELAALSAHRIPIPDLLIAACAQQHAASVLHVDRHYETLARVLVFEPRRVP